MQSVFVYNSAVFLNSNVVPGWYGNMLYVSPAILRTSKNIEEQYMWRFAHITDPHLSSTRNGIWNNRFLCSIMPEVMACLRNDIARLAPDFLLITGDIVSHRSREAVFKARDALDMLGHPYYPALGNHDTYNMAARAWFLEAYESRLPTANTVYTFVHKSLRFCILDPWWVWGDGSLMPTPEPKVAEQQETELRDARWALPPEQFVWLESVLKAYPQQPTCIALHYPALPVPTRLQHPGYQHAGALENGELLMNVVSDFPQVRAMFSGHVHTNSVTTFNGVTHITTSALPEYPVEFREVLVYTDRMEVKTRGLSDPSFAERTRIPGHEYTAGTDEDRDVVIPLG